MAMDMNMDMDSLDASFNYSTTWNIVKMNMNMDLEGLSNFLSNISTTSSELLHQLNSSAMAATEFFEFHNLTFPFSSESGSFLLSSFDFEDPVGIFLAVGIHYFATLVLTLAFFWGLNKLTIRSEILETLLETVISLLIVFPTFPVTILFFALLLGLRGLISLYLKLKYPCGKVSLLNPVDGFWAYETYASCSTSLGLYIIEGDCDLSKIRERMGKTVQSDVVEGKLGRKLTSVFGFSAWETIPKENNDMDKYVKLVDNNDGSHPSGEYEVFEVMKKIQDKPITEEEDKAPWEIYVIPRYFSQDCKVGVPYYAVIYRIHHALMDGISTANVLHSAMADKPFRFSVDPTKPLGGGKRNPTFLETYLPFLLGFISMPRVALRTLFLIDNYQNKYYLPGKQLTGPKTFTWSRPIKMEALKEIKNVTNTSVYTVLLSCLGGAFRRYRMKTEGHVDFESYHVMSPIALLPYPDRKPRNRFTGVIVPTLIGGEVEISPQDRLQKNYTSLKELGLTSASSLAISNWFFPVVLGLLPLCFHRPLCALVHLRLSLSNVPGPAEDVFIYDGGKITDCGIWLPIKYSLGFGMGFLSYKDKIRASIIGDNAYYPNECDIHFITKAFEHELTLLGNSVGVKNIIIE